MASGGQGGPRHDPGQYTESPTSSLRMGGFDIGQVLRRLPYAAQIELGARGLGYGISEGQQLIQGMPYMPFIRQGAAAIQQDAGVIGPWLGRQPVVQGLTYPIIQGARNIGRTFGGMFGGGGQPVTPTMAHPSDRPITTRTGMSTDPFATGGRRQDQGLSDIPEDVTQDIWQQQYDAYIATLQAQEDAIKAQYSPVIGGLEDDVGDLRRAAAALGMPFDEYLKLRHEIGAGVGDAPALEGSIKPVVNGIYDAAQADMKEVLSQIHVNYGEQLVAQVTDGIAEFEATMEDVIRTDEAGVTALHDASAMYAKALAQAGYSSDIYAAMDAETRLNAELEAKIRETSEDLARQKKAMNDSIKAARDAAAAQFQFKEPTLDELVDQSFNEYFRGANVNASEAQRAKEIFEYLRGNPANTLSETTWRRAVSQYMNEENLKSLGLDPDFLRNMVNTRIDQELITPEQAMQLENLINSGDIGNAFRLGSTKNISNILMNVVGLTPNEVAAAVKLGSQNADSLFTKASPEGKHLRNMYTQRRYIEDHQEEIFQSFGPKVNSEDLAVGMEGFTFPVLGEVKYSASFGYKRSKAQQAAGKSGTHQGIDIMAARGSPVVASLAGKVIAMGYDSKGGNFIKIRDQYGRVHYYAHLNNQSGNIQKGSNVRAGQVIGTVGNTGNARDTDPHLHYEIRMGEQRIDPYDWLRSTGR